MFGASNGELSSLAITYRLLVSNDEPVSSFAALVFWLLEQSHQTIMRSDQLSGMTIIFTLFADGGWKETIFAHRDLLIHYRQLSRSPCAI